MPVHRLLRGSGDFRGLDKRTSDLTRGIEHATDMKNAIYRSSGAISKRKGTHKHEKRDGVGSYGMFTYKKVDSTTGAVIDELLMVDTELRKLVDTNEQTNKVVLQYSGSEYIYYSMVFDEDTSSFKFKILLSEAGVVVDKDLTNINLDDLKTFIDAVIVDAGTPFVLTIPAEIPRDSVNGDLSPAEYFDIALNVSLNNGSVANNISYKYWSAIVRGDDEDSETFAGYKRDSNNYLKDEDLENATFVQMHDVVYISNGIDYMMKYDGDFVYKAGLPRPIITSALAGAGTATIAAGNYFYKVVYEFYDATGNFISSSETLSDEVTVGATQEVVITLPYITHISHTDYGAGGWNLDHDEDKLKIRVYRNTVNSDIVGNFYEIDQAALYTASGLVNNPANGGSIAITDIDADATYADNLVLAVQTQGIAQVDIIDKSPPPKGRYITSYKNCLILSGRRDSINSVHWSLPYNSKNAEIGCEGFPDVYNEKIIESSFGDKITAIAALRDVLYVFHTNSIHTLTGDIGDTEVDDPTTVDLLTKEGAVGCLSQSSIQELRGELLFLSESGLYGINTSNALREVSDKIKSLFSTGDILATRSNLIKKRAVGFNWIDQNLYILQMPTEALDNGSGTAYYANYTTSDSILVVYDYYRDAWLQWTNLDYSGGVALYNNKIFFNNRFIDTDGTISSELSSMSSSGSTHDYNDHLEAIPFEYDTNWESLMEPTVPKKYLRLKVYANDADRTFESAGFQLGIALQKDYNTTDLGTMIFDFDSGSQGGWGLAPWGEFGWGNTLNRHVQSKLPTGKAKSLKMRFKNEEYNTNVLITNYELEVVAPYQTEIKE